MWLSKCFIQILVLHSLGGRSPHKGITSRLPGITALHQGITMLHPAGRPVAAAAVRQGHLVGVIMHRLQRTTGHHHNTMVIMHRTQAMVPPQRMVGHLLTMTHRQDMGLHLIGASLQEMQEMEHPLVMVHHQAMVHHHQATVRPHQAMVHPRQDMGHPLAQSPHQHMGIRHPAMAHLLQAMAHLLLAMAHHQVTQSMVHHRQAMGRHLVSQESTAHHHQAMVHLQATAGLRQAMVDLQIRTAQQVAKVDLLARALQIRMALQEAKVEILATHPMVEPHQGAMHHLVDMALHLVMAVLLKDPRVQKLRLKVTVVQADQPPVDTVLLQVMADPEVEPHRMAMQVRHSNSQVDRHHCQQDGSR